MKNSSSNLGVGLGAATLAAALTYYLYGTKKGAKQREKFTEIAEKKWGEAKEKWENTKENLKERYNKFENVDKKHLKALDARIKKHWEEIEEDIANTLKNSGGDE